MRQPTRSSVIASAARVRGGRARQEHRRRRQGAWLVATRGDADGCPSRDRPRGEPVGASTNRNIFDGAGIRALATGSAAVRAHSISAARSGHRRIAFRSRDDEIGGKQDHRYAHPRSHRDRRMRFFRGGGAQARYIPAGAASIGSRSRARGSTKPVPTNGARIGAHLAGARARAPAEGRSQGARIWDRRNSNGAGYFHGPNSGRQHTPFRQRICCRKRSTNFLRCIRPRLSTSWMVLTSRCSMPCARAISTCCSGSSAPGLGDRRKRRVSLLQSLCRRCPAPAPARSRSQRHVARLGALRLDPAGSRNPAQGGI